MRFECDSCHAKYKISDEKVRGRVVRFPCRKCDHKILIDGRTGDPDVTVPAGAAYGFEAVTRKSTPGPQNRHDAPTARNRRPSSPVRRRPPSVPPRRPSTVSRRLSSNPAMAGTAFAGQHPGLAPPVPIAASPAASLGDMPEWHVSINDVPVGPVRLEEMGHKIDAGAVSEYSLIWREGFDEWRPLATVPELMALLHERRHSGLPPRPSFSSAPPFVDSRASIENAATVAGPVQARVGESQAPVDFEPLADALQPEGGSQGLLREMSQPPAPIGPAGVFESSPPLGAFSGLPAAPDEQVSVPSAPPPGAAASAEPRERLSLGVWILIIAVVSLAAVVAVLVFDRFGGSLLEDLWNEIGPVAARVPEPSPERTKPAAAAVPPEDSAIEAPKVPAQETAAQEAPAAGATTKASDNPTPAGDEPPKLVVEPPRPADEGPTIAPAPRPRTRAKVRRKPEPSPVAAAPESDSVSAADQKILDEFGSSADTAPATIDVRKSGGAKKKKPPLDGDGVRATVGANKPRLQRCYERAVRGQPSPPAVRLDVTVTVAASGRVKNVSAAGSGPGGLAECVEASVRRWRFPASSEGGPAKFPIVFSPN